MTIALKVKTYPFIRLAGLMLLLAWLTGCATSQSMLTDEALAVADLSPDEVRQSGATGSTVHWGGTIAGISHQADGTTAIELVSRPLHRGGRPIHNDKTEGRFIAETAEFLDPEIIKVGRDFTLVGTVTDVREGKVGEATYRFPIVEVDKYHYWKKQVVVRPLHFRHWNDHSPYYYDPFRRGWPFGPYRHSGRSKSGVSASLVFIQR